MTSQFFKNTLILLDSYESEESQDEMSIRGAIYKRNTVLGFVEHVLKIFMTRKKSVMQRLKNCEYYTYDCNNQLKHLKLSILNTKLHIMSEIILNKIKSNLAVFFDNTTKKIQMERLFSKDDNYLYFLPRPKLFKFKNHYAYRRILFVIKSYKYKRNFLLRNSFKRWRDILYSDEIFLDYGNKFRALSNLLDIISSKSTYMQVKRLYFRAWRIRTMKNDSSTKDRLFLRERYLKGLIAINKIFAGYKRKYFRKFYTISQQFINPNSNCFKVISSKLLETNYINNKQNNLKLTKEALANYNGLLINEKRENRFTNGLKALIKIITVTYVNKELNKRFYHWYRHSIINQRKVDIKNNTYLLKTILNLNITNGIKLLQNLIRRRKPSFSLRFYKRKFFYSVKEKIKINNTVKDYGSFYKRVLNFLSDDRRVSVLLMRTSFWKVIMIKKVVMLVMNKKYSHRMCPAKRSSLNFLLLSSFYKWKAVLIEEIRLNTKLKCSLRNMSTTVTCALKSYVIAKLKSTLSIKKDIFNQEQNCSLIKFINSLYGIHKKQIVKYAFNKLRYGSNMQHKSETTAKLKFVIFLKKHFELFNWFRLRNGFSTLKRYTILHSSKINKEFTDYIKKQIAIRAILNKRNNTDIKKFLDRFIYLRSNNKIHHRNKNRIDHMIVINMAGILLEYEHEDLRINREVLSNKFSLSKGACLLKAFYKTEQNMLRNSFNLFKNVTLFPNGVVNFDTLAQKIERIKSEDEELVATYRDKKQVYKRTIDDFEFMKKHFCSECLGENHEVDYKSVNEAEMNNESISDINEQIQMRTNEEGKDVYYNTISSSILDEDFKLDSKDEPQFKKVTNENLAAKVLELEAKTKQQMKEYESKLSFYENYVKSLEIKKQELLAIKHNIKR